MKFLWLKLLSKIVKRFPKLAKNMVELLNLAGIVGGLLKLGKQLKIETSYHIWSSQDK